MVWTCNFLWNSPVLTETGQTCIILAERNEGRRRGKWHIYQNINQKKEQLKKR